MLRLKCDLQSDENNNDSGVYVLKGYEINKQCELDYKDYCAETMDNEDKEGGSGWTGDDDLSYIAMEDSDKDDENSGILREKMATRGKTVVMATNKMVILVKMG